MWVGGGGVVGGCGGGVPGWGDVGGVHVGVYVCVCVCGVCVYVSVSVCVC